MKKAFVVKFFRLKKIMTLFRGKKFRLIIVPAVAVIQEEQTIFVIIELKIYVDCFFLNIIKF
jgi:hypothetical protein